MSYKLLYSDFILWITVLQSPWLIQWGWFFGAVPTILASSVPAVSHCSTSRGVPWSSGWAHPSKPRAYQLSTFGAAQRDLARNKMKILKCSSVKWKQVFLVFFYWSNEASEFLSVPGSVCGSNYWGNLTLQKGCTEEREDKGCVLTFYIQIIILALWERLNVLADIRSWKQWLYRTLCLEN